MVIGKTKKLKYGSQLTWRKRIAVLLLAIPIQPSVADPDVSDVLVSREPYLYVPQSDNRRLLLEPGSLLMEIKIPQRDVFKKRIRVISPGGVEGEVRAGGVDRVSAMTDKLGYAKQETQIKRNKYPNGAIFPVMEIDEDGEVSYEVRYPQSSYSVQRGRFLLKERKKIYTKSEFTSSFNLIDPETASYYQFPYWVRSAEHGPTEWGCGESSEMSRTVDASVGANVEASGGFFGFFRATAKTSGEASTTTVYKKLLTDPSYKHRITYWDLLANKDDNRKLIRVALEKVSVCDTSKGVNNGYIIRFENKHGFDEITINSVWVAEKGLKKGGGSPVRIDDLADLRAFKKALTDFKFMDSLDGYDIKTAIVDFAVKLVANLNYQGR